MCAVSYKIGDPYRLQGSRIVFTNWHYVYQGSFCWVDEEGNNVSVKGTQDPFQASFKDEDYPWGIRIQVNEAEKTGPVFNAEAEWEEGGISIGTVFKEGGTYRAWGNTNWGSSLKGRGMDYLTYYESEDGYAWRRPKVGIVEYKGNTDNNLMYGPKYAGTVFIDPTSGSERYKVACEAVFTPEEYSNYLKGNSKFKAVEAAALAGNRIFGMQGAVSPDGLHWTVLSEPLAITISDTQLVGYYDAFLKKYVIYSRDWVAGPQVEEYVGEGSPRRWSRVGRRAINRTESDDFRSFPLPELIIEPHPQMPPYEVIYTNCRTAVPGAPDQHLMFPAIWVKSGGDYTYITMYSSHNGKVWNQVSQGPVLKTSIFGSWDGGCVFASPNLIELPNGDFALPYTGWNVPHKYPRIKAQRGTGYALWPKGRLCALKADEKGEFSTVAIMSPGNRLSINAVTERAGYILVEACNMNGEPIAGHEFEQSVPLFGDCYKTPVVWRNADNLGIGRDEAVILRFRMYKAGIYGLDFA